MEIVDSVVKKSVEAIKKTPSDPKKFAAIFFSISLLAFIFCATNAVVSFTGKHHIHAVLPAMYMGGAFVWIFSTGLGAMFIHQHQKPTSWHLDLSPPSNPV